MSVDDTIPALSAEDQRALDWLGEHGFDPSDAPPEIRARVERLADLLAAAAHADAEHDTRLTELVMERLIPRAGARVELSEADQDALDALMLSGLDAGRVPSGLRDRAERITGFGALLESAAITHSPALTERVLAAVDAHTDSIDADRPVAGRIGGRFADLISVAAVLLIAASVMWPVLTSMRESSIRQANQANLAVAGLGFGAYSADYDGELPRVSDRVQPDSWWEVGDARARSNSAGLFTLARLQYTPAEALSSPGNPAAPHSPAALDAMDWRTSKEVSYSYVLPSGNSNRPAGPEVILADRSPIIVRLLAGEPAFVSENSPNHDGRGQHMLHGDGSVVWTTEPYTAYGDHIYLPRAVERAVDSIRRQLEMPIDRLPIPSDRADVFLGP